MPDSLQLVLALLLTLIGVAWLALAMQGHWRQVRGDRALTSRTALTLRCLGALALASSLLLYLGVDHGSMASLVWTMSLVASAVIVAFVLSWRPSTLAWLLAWVRG